MRIQPTTMAPNMLNVVRVLVVLLAAGVTLGSEQRHVSLLARYEVSDPGRIDVVPGDTNHASEILIVYRELEVGEPEAAEGTLFTVSYSWNPRIRAVVPRSVSDGVTVSTGKLTGLFPSDECIDVGPTITRWDSVMHAASGDIPISITAAKKPGTSLPVPVQSLHVGIGRFEESIVLEEEIQNLYYVTAKVVDIDGDGSEEILVAVGFYKNRGLYILGTRGQAWLQMSIPSFTSRAAAREYLKTHNAGVKQ